MRFFAPLAYLLIAIALSLVGGKVSEHRGNPYWVGAVVGGVGHVPGFAVMCCAFVVRDTFFQG